MDFFPFKPEKPRSYSYPRVKVKFKRARMPSNGLFATECDVLESPSLKASVFQFRIRCEEKNPRSRQ